jgi:cephalosporin hydroxylase
MRGFENDTDPAVIAVRIAKDLARGAAFAANFGRRAAERQELARCDTPDDYFDFAVRHFGVGPVQLRGEIVPLLQMLAEHDVRRVCEIGVFQGGTSLLLSHALPRVETVILVDLFVRQRWRLRSLRPRGQRMVAIDGSSHSPSCSARVARALRGERLDFLLIDGDHSYSGVKRDFLTYRHMVRDGGVIAFHDIVPVHSNGGGRWVGGVPTFWSEVRELYPSQEYVQDPQQDGLGIGTLRYSADVTVDGLESGLPLLARA